MIGSEKQVTWATKIRDENIRKLEREIAEYETRTAYEKAQGYDVDYSHIVSKLKKAVEEIKSTDKPAKFWIDNKNLSGAYIQKIKNI